jgi:ABC-type oligopeptide transport system substrate-binding subunit
VFVLKKVSFLFYVLLSLLLIFGCNSNSYTLLLLGEPEVSIEVYSFYTDPGARAVNKDKVLIDYNINGFVDVSKVGDYVLTYSIEGYDKTVERTVHVVDSTPPVIQTDFVTLPLVENPIDWTHFNFEVFDNYSLQLTVEVISDEIIYDEPGNYDLWIKVTDESGNFTTKNITIYMVLLNANGDYDLSVLSAEDKVGIINALERYLIDNVIGGVPLFRFGSLTLFSTRVSLFSNQYNLVLGYGEEFSSLTQDDTNVLMYGETYGYADEYTWRDSYTSDLTSLNPWNNEEHYLTNFTDLFSAGLYKTYFDDLKLGYVIDADLASGDPVPLDGYEENGKILATTWEIPVRNDLVWSFHPDTDVSSLSSGYETLNAEDFLWTWKYALDNRWYEAIHGGNDFVSWGIKNVSEYLSGDATWDEVGLKNVNGVIQLEFTSAKSILEIKYVASTLSPINKELFEKLTPVGYGLSPETVASCGAYVLNTWNKGELLTYTKNDNYPHASLYHYTGLQYLYVDSDEDRLEEFLAGKLDCASVPSERINEFISDERVKIVPNNSVWRLMINGFGTEEIRDEYISEHPNLGLSEDFVPEPILQYLEMKQALYYGINRYEATLEAKSLLPAYTYYNENYIFDSESGMSIYETESGMSILIDFGKDSYGYDPNLAIALFKQAVSKAISDGFYQAGTEEYPTIIEFEFVNVLSGNSRLHTFVNEMILQYEELLYDDVNHVGIHFNVIEVAFPENYNDYLMIANADLGVGGISESIEGINPLNTCDDQNSSGFTLNWGIDTSSANIKVSYTNQEGNKIYELWSFNGLISALEKQTTIIDGQIQTP